MNPGQILKYSFIGVFIIGLFVILISCISASNREVELRNKFTEQFDNRSALYDKVFKTIKQKGQVAKQNDSSFRYNVNAIMAGRKDAEGLMMKWIQESNPNANFSEVSALYKDLSRAIEAQREEFFQQEKLLRSVKREHDDLLGKFPGGFLLKTILGRKNLEYTPITSDRTENAVKTGKDNDIEVF